MWLVRAFNGWLTASVNHGTTEIPLLKIRRSIKECTSVSTNPTCSNSAPTSRSIDLLNGILTLSQMRTPLGPRFSRVILIE
ncbi:hypothetical protein RHMOL_Rhmol13G0091400 [Rhododendron molle]|uniref:Uncharacterized protein n=1 Tax=Rhododendron molle TaxID=49168 RepID=A0ACC0L5R0_RHOML|nr:hypothetical protein RHMOL_Rhmol13G0091400 [Rhododendron molle]